VFISRLQSRLREEVLTKGRDLGYEDIQKLEFLDAVVKEGLRLHPPSPQTERVVLRDDVIPLSTPIKGADGKMINFVRVKKDQVCTTFSTSK
jgi:cytochrome P450